MKNSNDQIPGAQVGEGEDTRLACSRTTHSHALFALASPSLVIVRTASSVSGPHTLAVVELVRGVPDSLYIQQLSIVTPVASSPVRFWRY